MSRTIIRFIKSRPEAMVPSRESDQAAGYDLTSIEGLTIQPMSRALVHTGICVAIPKGHHLEIRPRSGLALKHGITVLNSPGTIDPDYRGEIMVILFNASDVPFDVHKGDRIAQAVVMSHGEADWCEVSGFDTTSRGTCGFGSTGRR